MTAMQTRLVALDIDGTLLAPGVDALALPDPAIVAAIRALTDAGVVVVLASGRMFPGTARIAHALGLDGPLVCQQGAAVHAVDGRLLHTATLDPLIARELVDFAAERGHPYAWFDPHRYCVSVQNPASTEYGRVSGIVPQYGPLPAGAVLQPTGIDIISSPQLATGIHAELAGRYGDRVHLLDFPSVTVATAPDASKAVAVARIAAAIGCEADAVVAVGDSVNDAPMLAWAGRGIAMPHADRFARAAADEQLGGVGVAAMPALLRSLLP